MTSVMRIVKEEIAHNSEFDIVEICCPGFPEIRIYDAIVWTNYTDYMIAQKGQNVSSVLLLKDEIDYMTRGRREIDNKSILCITILRQ